MITWVCNGKARTPNMVQQFSEERQMMKFLRRFKAGNSRHFATTTLFLVLGGVPSAALSASEYRLDVGDVLELSIVGLPDGRPQAIPVELNGEASFPLIGGVQASGKTLPELRNVLRERLSHQVYKYRTLNGQDALLSIEPREITLRIASYRPVYLTGDVARTGEVPYRPGLTVRQATSIAGGYNVLRSETSNSLVESLELKNQQDLFAVGIAKERARVWRLGSALGKPSSLGPSEFPDIDPEVLREIISVEQRLLKVSQEDYTQQKRFLTSAISLAEQRISALSMQAKAESEGAKLDEQDLERIADLAKRGLTPLTKVTDVRRAALLSSSRALQTSVASDAVIREREDLKARLQKLEDSRTSELLRELSEATAKLDGLRTQIRGVKERLAVFGAAKLSVLRGPGSKLQISVFRKEGDQTTRIAADEDTLLKPGDVVEINLDVSASAAAATVDDRGSRKAAMK